MTRYDQLLTTLVAREMKGVTPRQAAARLLAGGLLDLRACEQQFACEHVIKLVREGSSRGQAMTSTAKLLNCSYAKVRTLYYNHHKTTSK